MTINKIQSLGERPKGLLSLMYHVKHDPKVRDSFMQDRNAVMDAFQLSGPQKDTIINFFPEAVAVPNPNMDEVTQALIGDDDPPTFW